MASLATLDGAEQQQRVVEEESTNKNQNQSQNKKTGKKDNVAGRTPRRVRRFGGRCCRWLVERRFGFIKATLERDDGSVEVSTLRLSFLQIHQRGRSQGGFGKVRF